MSFESSYPKYKEGEVIGWVVVYGIRGEFRAFIDRAEGHTKALNRASDLHGRVLPALAGEDFVWRPAAGDGL